MELDGAERRLAAIMFTDVVGYAALTERDEAAAVRVREQHRDLLHTLVRQFEGEVVDATGDESFSVFPSALCAVDCALALQGALRSYRDLRVRIGIHLGDVLRRNGEVIGEGVNVAARVRPLAEPGGICISEPVYQMVRSRPHLNARALGRQSLKNVGQPIPVYALSVTEPGEAAGPARRRGRLALGAVLAAAVLAVPVVGYRGVIGSWLALNVPRFLSSPIEQQIGFAETKDGVRIAYATTGSGPPVVFVLGWATHMKEGLGSPLYDLGGAIRWYSQHHRVVRYDGRGFGLSDRDATDFELDARVLDLEAVVDALGLKQFALYAASAGGWTGIAYASRHPDRVSHLVLAATNAGRASVPEEEKRVPDDVWASRVDLMRSSWDAPPTRAMVVELMAPEAGEVERRVLMHFLSLSADGPAMAGFFDAGMRIDVSEEARRIRVPTLVVSPDSSVPMGVAGGLRLASLIPGARFEILEGANHIAGSVTDPRLLEMALAFVGEGSAGRR